MTDYLDEHLFEDYVLQMLYYGRTDIRERIDPIKECMNCYYWSFNQGFKFQDSVCNGCHDLIMLIVVVFKSL